MMRAFLLALQFLTRLPVPGARSYDERLLGHSVLFYPWVGLIIGALLAALAILLAQAPVNLAAALILVAWVLLTGALHLDGLADSADAWVGGHGDRERTLAIMKDPNAGPVGVTLVVLVLLVKYAGLQTLLSAPSQAAILLVPLLGRAAIPLLFLTTPYVRPGGLGEAMAQHLPRGAAVLTLTASVLLALTLTGPLPLLAAAGVFLVLRALMRRRLGGTTGDTAGALVETIEAAALAAAALGG